MGVQASTPLQVDDAPASEQTQTPEASDQPQADTQASEQAETDPDVGEKAYHSAKRYYFLLWEAFPNYVQDFQAKWKAWEEAISSSTDPSTWFSVPEFNTLIALGPKVLPLVVWEIAKHLNELDKTAPAVFIYNELEPDPEYVAPLGDLAHQTDHIVEKNFHRSRKIRNAFMDWAEHCDRMAFDASVTSRTECREFDDLVDMGPAIIPHMMLRYDPDKPDYQMFGFELLHAVVWGYTARRMVWFMDYEHAAWVRWFEIGDHELAPHYCRPPEDDSLIWDYRVNNWVPKEEYRDV